MELLVAHAPTVALLFFFSVFVGVFVWLVRPGMKQKMQRYARIPLEEDAHGRE